MKASGRASRLVLPRGQRGHHIMAMVSRSPILGQLYLLRTIHNLRHFLLLPLLSTRPHRISHTLPTPSLLGLRSSLRLISRRHRSTSMTVVNMSQRDTLLSRTPTTNLHPLRRINLTQTLDITNLRIVTPW